MTEIIIVDESSMAWPEADITYPAASGKTQAIVEGLTKTPRVMTLAEIQAAPHPEPQAFIHALTGFVDALQTPGEKYMRIYQRNESLLILPGAVAWPKRLL